MRVFSTMFLFLVSNILFAQIKPLSIPKDSVHFKGRYKGNIKHIYKWNDKLGQNYLVLSVTNETPSKAKISGYKEDCDGSCTDIELYAYHFIGTDSILWKVQDFERACNWDNVVKFRPNSIKITDLDSNGIAEVWMMYSLTCTSDVSPSRLKLIVYQGNKKAVIRGTSQPARNMIDQEFGGKYNPDQQFLSLPKKFQQYGEKLWKYNLYDM
ncbi:MAG TPA: hypothetical protein VEZ55_01360 [Chitinophagaceae bacterium]|nr:hypothetical protein [Chitinophagaceae bacterium]